MATKFRDRLPAKSLKSDTSIWTVLKTCVGKDLSKITMPVKFNEPLSFLQRIAESLEYSELLSEANLSRTQNPIDRLEVVGAFAVSGLASNWNRLGKPFNPLLHETYELATDDYKLVCEQVSHHPPISAFHAESSEFVFQGWIQPKLKLWGKSVEIHPKGSMKLYLKRFNETYTWSNVNCTVHNVIVGKLWIEHHGTMEITCAESSLKLAVHFKPAGWFNNELHRMEGFVVDNKKNKLRFLYGKWTDFLRSTDIESYEEYIKTNAHKFKLGLGDSAAATDAKKSPSVSPSPSRKMFQKFNSLSIRSFSTSVDTGEGSDDLSPENQEDVIPKSDGEVMDIANSITLWEAITRPDYAPDYYHFTLFAMGLNQALPDVPYPSTDSRLRPDIRNLETGEIDLAHEEKTRLEDKQRKLLKHNKEDVKPNYFEKNGDDWHFLNNYWDHPKALIKNLFD
ncbi:unnamed protein product [Allacma fusca]|uniref:Oxysterol-binding protein n=1 Tax=Allacma fusca TaxID=39272 RepID=A0A8J2LG68_9HEXA|nr:unnamed protein product [Allacma fusca]